jgi:hypothetical protein
MQVPDTKADLLLKSKGRSRYACQLRKRLRLSLCKHTHATNMDTYLDTLVALLDEMDTDVEWVFVVIHTFGQCWGSESRFGSGPFCQSRKF